MPSWPAKCISLGRRMDNPRDLENCVHPDSLIIKLGNLICTQGKLIHCWPQNGNVGNQMKWIIKFDWYKKSKLKCPLVNLKLIWEIVIKQCRNIIYSCQKIEYWLIYKWVLRWNKAIILYNYQLTVWTYNHRNHIDFNLLSIYFKFKLTL